MKADRLVPGHRFHVGLYLESALFVALKPFRIPQQALEDVLIALSVTTKATELHPRFNRARDACVQFCHGPALRCGCTDVSVPGFNRQV